MSLPTLSIVIPSCNGLGHLQRCLPSVCRFAPVGTQILVIDDASTDDTASWVRHCHPGIELERLGTNLGFCGAVNAGLERARGEVVELLNNDTEVSEGWAEASLRHFADPTVGSVAPLAVRMDDPQTIDSAGQEYHTCGWACERLHGHALATEDLSPREVFGASASCGFYRRDALQKVGGLWTICAAYIEDTDLAFRLRWAGYRCIFEPASRVAHKGSASYGRQSDRQVFLISRNEEMVFWANLPRSRLLFSLAPHVGFLAVRLMRKIFQCQAGPYLAGKIDALGKLRSILDRRKEARSLARTSRRHIDLSVRTDLQVLRHGIDWLRNRRCA
jgi:GT2 family glycosyltransferase